MHDLVLKQHLSLTIGKDTRVGDCRVPFPFLNLPPQLGMRPMEFVKDVPEQPIAF